jgi:hypothetical protein
VKNEAAKYGIKVDVQAAKDESSMVEQLNLAPLGTLIVFRSAALIDTNGQPICGLPEGFRAAFGGRHDEIGQL